MAKGVWLARVEMRGRVSLHGFLRCKPCMALRDARALVGHLCCVRRYRGREKAGTALGVRVDPGQFLCILSKLAFEFM